MATCQTNNQMRYMRRTMPDTSCPCPRNSSYERMYRIPGTFSLQICRLQWHMFHGKNGRTFMNRAALLKTERSLRN